MLRVLTGLLNDTVLGLLDLLFPPRCPGCDRIDQRFFCRDCLDELEWLDPDEGCPRCGEQTAGGDVPDKAICAACRERPPIFAQVVSALRYSTPLTRAISLWKYENERDLSGMFAELLSEWAACRAPRWWEKIEAVVPVPHHPKTMRARGFSPSEELAENLARRFALPCLSRTVFKTRFTPRQAGLDQARRRSNLHLSMKVFDASLVDGKIILVVDDVITTGTTMDECARALTEAGASRVYGLALARQTLGNPRN